MAGIFEASKATKSTKMPEMLFAIYLRAKALCLSSISAQGCCLKVLTVDEI